MIDRFILTDDKMSRDDGDHCAWNNDNVLWWSLQGPNREPWGAIECGHGQVKYCT